jgi:hypothetical protein
MAANDLVEVAFCNSAEQALVVESLLKGAGIQPVRQESGASLGEPITGQMGGAPGEGITIYVRRADVERAKEILEVGELEREEGEGVEGSD